ncbi:hypothetical protein CYFUS_007457 [Cystobacter fuscus]|uniref:Uncharacterized protein n=1 Tax=Cystobacter fuscus TaxID=43 RepID=A0A250JF03_9BACT|nr:hypothetical protein [Cystobacter fuscus]ATB41981.1 hypothetical protein CYFUS_007457 [Cystobacter fuscus]
MARIESLWIELLLPRTPWEWKDVLLDKFERHPTFAPTHWGQSARVREPYRREELERFCGEEGEREDPSLPTLRRTQRPLYVASWSLGDGPGWLEVEARMMLEPEESASYFDFANHLASALPLEFGLVDIAFQGVPRALAMNPSGRQHVDVYVECGPTTLFARTYFGPRLIKLMGGLPALEGSGGVVHRLGNGVVALDLVATPWQAEAKALKQHQKQVLEKLLPTGIFMRREQLFSEPGPRWVPPSTS